MRVALVRTTRRRRLLDRLPDRLTSSLALQWVAGRNWPAYRHGDRSRYCRLGGNDPPQISVIPPASAESLRLVQTRLFARLLVRSESERGRALHCRTIARLQTSANPAWRAR